MDDHNAPLNMKQIFFCLVMLNDIRSSIFSSCHLSVLSFQIPVAYHWMAANIELMASTEPLMAV